MAYIKNGSLMSVKNRQNFLKRFCYYTGAIDGIVGSGTKAAIEAFQKATGLTADGIWGNDTDREARYYTSLLQMKLGNLGLYKNGSGKTPSGLCGDGTEKGVKAFQKLKGLVEDGLVGKNTLKALGFSIKKPTWSDIKHFKKTEMKCGCNGRYCNGYPVEPNLYLMRIMDLLRDYYGKAMTVTSGVRCAKYNASLVGSVPNSAHKTGKAADFVMTTHGANKTSRHTVTDRCITFGARYAYCDTPNMGQAIHLNV